MIDNERIKKAVERYVGFRGWEIIEDEAYGDSILIAHDTEEDQIVIVKYGESEVGFELEPMPFVDFENVMLDFFEDYDELNDIVIRHDIIDLHVIASDRAIIRHHVNVFNDLTSEV